MSAGHFNTRINIKFYLSPVSNRTLSVSEKILHLRNGLRIWRRTRDLTEKTGNLTEGWWKTDRGSQYFDTLPFITHTRALFGIFGTKLICFTFCEAPSIEHEHKRKYWVFWHESVTDGLMVSLEGLTAFATSRGLALPIPMIPAHMWTRLLLHIDNGTNQSLCITFEHFGTALYIEYWTEFCGHVPLLQTHPSPHVDIWIKQGSNITNVGHYLRSDQYQHVWTTSAKINREKHENILLHIF